MTRFPMSRVLAACAAASLVACAQNAGDGSDSEDIIGGVDGAAKAMNAVGTLGTKDSSGNYSFFCSASLIGPHTVLTAKHCAIVLDGALAGMKLVNLIPIYFAVGPDAKHPLKVVEAIAADTSRVEAGGFVGLGNDVAVYQLVEDITDIKPLRVAVAPLAQADMGKKFVGIGFGAQSVYEDLTGDLASTRKMGAETSRALQGKSFELMLGSYENFREQMVYEYGEDVIAQYEAEVKSWYNDTTLLAGYEGWFGNAAGDVQTCHGDSGGPLLHKATAEGKLTDRSNSSLAIWGVVSGGWHSRDLTCDYGTFYAAIGPKTLDLVGAALKYKDPCKTSAKVYDAKGACEGTVAKRCSDKWEGDRKLAIVDCADVNLVCKTDTAGRAGCFDQDETNPAPPAPPAHPAPPTASALKQQVFEASQGLHRGVVQKLQGRH